MTKKKEINIALIIIQLLLIIAIIYFLICDANGFKTIHENPYYCAQCCINSLLWSLLPYCLRILKIRTTKIAQVYFVIAVMGHFVGGNILNLYAINKFYNYFLHAFNSVMIGAFIYSILLQHLKTENKLFMFFITVCCVVALGVFWEMYEYLADDWWGRNMQRHHNSITGEPFIGRQAVMDTMRDLFMDLFGGVAGFFVAQIKFGEYPFYSIFELQFLKPIKPIFGTVTYYSGFNKSAKTKSQENTSIKQENVKIEEIKDEKMLN